MEISEAAGGGWKTLTTMPHSDRLDFSVIEKYWHLEATSTPDNENKNRVLIIHLECETETTNFHTQHYQHETDGVLYRSCLDTAECHQLQEQHAAFELDKRREVTIKLLWYEHQLDPTSSEIGFKVEMFTKQQWRINQAFQ